MKLPAMLLRAALASPPAALALEQAAPNSRVASWLQSYTNGLGVNCADAVEEREFTVGTYYQNNENVVVEAFRGFNGVWVQGALRVPAVKESPLATIHWADPLLGGDVRLVYFVKPGTQILTEIRHHNGKWQLERPLGPKVNMREDMPGSIGAVVRDEPVGRKRIQIMYRSSDNIVKICSYVFDEAAPTARCDDNGAEWRDAQDGTSIAGFVDQRGLPHFLYQLDASPKNVTEVAWDGLAWSRSDVLQPYNEKAGIQLAAVQARMPAGSPWPEPNRHLFDSTQGLAWRMWTPLCPWGGWCPQWYTPGTPPNHLVGLAAAGCTTNVRVYYLVRAGISEMSYQGGGWTISNTNILA